MLPEALTIALGILGGLGLLGWAVWHGLCVRVSDALRWGKPEEARR
jgi:hypothetical protein